MLEMPAPDRCLKELGGLLPLTSLFQVQLRLLLDAKALVELESYSL
jgi:hypothetical protein